MERNGAHNFTLARLWMAGDTDGASAELRKLIRQPGTVVTLACHWATVLGDPQRALDLRTGPGEVAAITGNWADLCRPVNGDFV